jgi:shikimate kinase/3-dehydroquinate synthase
VVAGLNRHIALAGFMGAGKSTIGRDVASRLGRPFVDLDDELERRHGSPVPALWETFGRAEFRRLEEAAALDVLDRAERSVIALGGGTLEGERVRKQLRRQAFTVLLEIDAAGAWDRVSGSDRPLARDEREFHDLHGSRLPVYDAVADARAADADGVVLAVGGVLVEPGALGAGAEVVPGAGRVALVADEYVARLHAAPLRAGLPDRVRSVHLLPHGEAAKSLTHYARLLDELTLDRRGTLLALGGGSTTDLGGFVAATYLRGIAWIAVPTTLVGQVDAAIGGKTGIDLAAGKNLAGAFHWPARTVVDPDVLETLPARERRNGLAEVVKTGLLAGEPLWELQDPALVRRAAAYKTAVCVRDPYDEGPREQLNLGHTFGHALEAASGYALPHGEAVALGLRAALRLSGLDTAPVDDTLAPQPVAVDRERAWEALLRDKKARDGRIRLVLLDAPGRPRTGVELPRRDVRAALDELIADA